MKTILGVAAAIGAFTLLGYPVRGASAGHLAPVTPRTVWDSVYTDSQAQRGDTLYKQTCARCHGATLTGTDSAAELSGKAFLDNWHSQTLDQLDDKILTSMPPDKPNSVPRTQVADIIAYILSQNHFPAGRTPLSDDAAQLKDITLLKSHP